MLTTYCTTWNISQPAIAGHTVCHTLYTGVYVVQEDKVVYFSMRGILRTTVIALMGQQRL